MSEPVIAPSKSSDRWKTISACQGLSEWDVQVLFAVCDDRSWTAGGVFTFLPCRPLLPGGPSFPSGPWNRRYYIIVTSYCHISECNECISLNFENVPVSQQVDLEQKSRRRVLQWVFLCIWADLSLHHGVHILTPCISKRTYTLTEPFLTSTINDLESLPSSNTVVAEEKADPCWSNSALTCLNLIWSFSGNSHELCFCVSLENMHVETLTAVHLYFQHTSFKNLQKIKGHCVPQTEMSLGLAKDLLLSLIESKHVASPAGCQRTSPANKVSWDRCCFWLYVK